jgi:hypothetical protein
MEGPLIPLVSEHYPHWKADLCRPFGLVSPIYPQQTGVSVEINLLAFRSPQCFIQVKQV